MTQHKTTKLPKTFWSTLFGLLFFCFALLVYMLIIPHHSASANDYPIQGFDVSHHQGDIQWEKISPKTYQFVYLKATEGGDFKDRKFEENWLRAREKGFLVGAYHFYRLCRDGSIQAKNFIETVPNKKDTLPPVIDLEYDSHCINTFTKEQLLKEIQIMHDLLYQHYGKQPIFYISKSFYNIVLVDQFKNTPLWIREYQGKPLLKNNPSWLLWQHTNQGKITGISTEVDLNVFNGDAPEWDAFLKKNQIHAISY
ncbi:lysozyme [Acinetobacter sp. ANC 4558]|uniref:glycoside hydrolase family 25 protein n=1 Tax=Acinetobacter sp. ANC 4558 TaxID=1977876 RepID=UPI000A336EF4|nr:GH25 family lysozyme [Acinetobacter sp. ANC 4558]OTG81268.1 lysozyme [Acinetobacter sp. ANC 4558]